MSPFTDKETLYCVLWEGNSCYPDYSNMVDSRLCKTASSTRTSNSLIPVITGLFFLTIALLGLVMLRRYWLRKQRKAIENLSEEEDEGELVSYEPTPAHIQTGLPINSMVGYPMATYPMQSAVYPMATQGYPAAGGVQLFPVHPMMQTNVDPLASMTPIYTSTRPGFGGM